MVFKGMDVAMNFYDSLGDEDELVIQVAHMSQVPEVKRDILSRLGVPSKSLYKTLWYGGRKISIVSVRDQESVADKDYIFLVTSPLGDNNRWLCELDGIGDMNLLKDCFCMWEDCGHQLSDIYNLLLREDCSHAGAMVLLRSYLKSSRGREGYEVGGYVARR
jgi:hypothetical protein